MKIFECCNNESWVAIGIIVGGNGGMISPLLSGAAIKMVCTEKDPSAFAISGLIVGVIGAISSIQALQLSLRGGYDWEEIRSCKANMTLSFIVLFNLLGTFVSSIALFEFFTKTK